MRLSLGTIIGSCFNAIRVADARTLNSRQNKAAATRCVLQATDCSYIPTYYTEALCCLLYADGVIAGRFDNAPGPKQRRILLSLSCQLARFTI